MVTTRKPVRADWARVQARGVADAGEHPERVDPWLATTARHECLRSVTARKKVVFASDESGLDQVPAPEPDIDEGLLAVERAQDVRDALSCLPRRWQQLLQLLMTDPPASTVTPRYPASSASQSAAAALPGRDASPDCASTCRLLRQGRPHSRPQRPPELTGSRLSPDLCRWARHSARCPRSLRTSMAGGARCPAPAPQW